MSRIRRLSIRGIRNFGDDNEEESMIRFQRPLTLILGPNGTGKTTIIEALKYVTTGDYPPNSGSGKSFIHDPILTRASSVRCAVKAELLDTQGNVYIVSKTAESTRTNKTLKIKAIDNTFTRVKSSSKEKVSLTKRCADTNTEVLFAMGVSKALLNYVIFCHQEELNWPFEEGAQLKKKFDEIFDTSRYNKALETVTKLVKSSTEENRVLKTEKEYLGNAVKEVENKEEKLQYQEQRLEAMRKKIADINKRLEPLTENIKKREKIDADYKKKLAEHESRQMEYNLSKQQMNSIKKNIQEIYEGTTDELKEYISSHDDGLLKKNNEISELEDRLKRVGKEEARIEKMLAEERVTVGSLKQQVEYQQKRTILRNNLLNRALSAWNLETVPGNISEIEVTALTKRLEEKLKELEENVDKNRQEMEKEEREYQKKVDVLRAEKSKIESEKNVKEKDIAKIRDEISQIRNNISQVGAAANKLTTVEAEYKEASNKINVLQSALNVDAVKEEIQKEIKSRDNIEEALNKIDAEIASLLKQSSLQTELELHKSTLSNNEKQLESLKSTHECDLKMLLGVNEIPEDKLKEKLETVQEKLANEIQQLMRKIQTEQHQLTTLQTTQKCDEKEYKKRISELESDKEKITLVCDYKMFDETLLLQEKKVKDLEDRRGMYAYKNIAYKEYLKKLKESDPSCPLCHRNFCNSDNVEHLISEMALEMKNHPSHLKQCEEELKTQRKRYEYMLQLKPTVAKVIQLEEEEIKKIKENIEKNKDQIENVEKSIKELQACLAAPERKQLKCKEIMNDMMLWDQCLSEIQKCNKEICNVQNRLLNAGVNSQRTIEEAQAERERLKTSLKTVRDRIDSLQSQLNAHVEKLQQARDKCNKLHEEQLRIRSEMQKLKQLRDKQDELYSREVSLGESVQDLRQSLTTADDALDLAIKKLEETKKENRKSLENERKLVEEGSNRLFELRKIQNEVEGFFRKNIAEALSQSELQIENYKTSIEKFVDDKRSLQNSINNTRDDIARQEIKKRDLMDNLSLRNIQEKAEKLHSQCKELKEDLVNMNHQQVLKEWNEFKRQEEILLQEKNIAKGNEEELVRSVKQYQFELRKDENRLARQKYKKKCIEQKVQEEVILNLKAYSKALDIAMIEYHEERMNTINKIMKKLWEIVYKGTDTTSIEIRTDATEGVGGSRRTYNYKLIQKKHGKEMDMRGRCSAGQKVLASIIIRLALAETFCTNCGILALDEPTTNLDEENANSLADALSSIVRYRSENNKNFQLILITHDEKFLLKIAGMSDTRTFYELYRKGNGMTGIKCCEIDNRESLSMPIKEAESSASEDEDHHDSGVSTQQRSIQQRTRTSQQKRWNDDDDEHINDRPTKKRYVFQME